MHHETFQTQIKRLQRAYGADSYPQECIEALWFELKHIPGKVFVEAVNKILADNVNRRYPPGLRKIEEKIAEIRGHAWKEEKEKNGSSIKGVSAEQVSKTLREILESEGLDNESAM